MGHCVCMHVRVYVCVSGGINIFLALTGSVLESLVCDRLKKQPITKQKERGSGNVERSRNI